MHRKFWKYILFCTTLIFIMGELIGRFYGFCNHPVFIESKAYEYNYAPNQDLKINRNHFFTNEYSMRSKPINYEKDSIVVLLIGDSVINGGATTDHEKLASSILEKRLSEYFNKNVRVLNISCGSWGPDNAAAYIKKYGTFGANLMIQVVSSHDAIDHMTFKKKVGSGLFPDKQSFLAWRKIIAILLNKAKKIKKKSSTIDLSKYDYLNTGFEYFQNLSQEKNIPLFLYLHASQREIEKTKSLKDKLTITQFCDDKGIKIIDELQLGISKFYLRDHIHYNDHGQRFLADHLFLEIKKYPL